MLGCLVGAPIVTIPGQITVCRFLNGERLKDDSGVCLGLVGELARLTLRLVKAQQVRTIGVLVVVSGSERAQGVLAMGQG